MDATGVDMQIVMPPPSQCYYTVPQEIGGFEGKDFAVVFDVLARISGVAK
jgi:hypothetical protein